MKFFKSSSAEYAGADNNSSEDGVVGCTTATDDDLNDEVDPLLYTPPIRCQMMLTMVTLIK